MSDNMRNLRTLRRYGIFAILSLSLSCSQEIGLPPGKFVTVTSCSDGEFSAESGQILYGTDNHTEFVVGDDASPIIITAPHGGYDAPSNIPDRTVGVTDQDLATQELSRDIADAIKEQTGLRPHLIICKLHRKKMDGNRPSGEAAQNNAHALKAWEDYHCFIDQAKKRSPIMLAKE